jgi:hypothetical protein
MSTIEECFQEAGNDLTAFLTRMIPKERIVRWFYETDIPTLGGTPAAVAAREGSGKVMEYFTEQFAAMNGAYDMEDEYV